jgi:hypothetical protein
MTEAKASTPNQKRQFISLLHYSSESPDGFSWWGRRPAWVRHTTYWIIALALLSVTVFVDEAQDVATDVDLLTTASGYGLFIFLLIAVMALVATLTELDDVGIPRTISRSLVLLAMVLGLSALALSYLTGTGSVEITACRVEGEIEVCSGQASPRAHLGMLAWQAADVVPVLRITDSFEWERPARSDSLVAGAVIMMTRLWVAVGVLAIIKRLWDKWGPSRMEGSSGQQEQSR